MTIKRILVITNLYPVPWGVNRASFNKQQFDRLALKTDVSIVILLPWTEWKKHYNECQSTDKIKYCPYFYIPKFGRRLVPFFQRLSLFCILPWMKKQQADVLYSSWGFPDAVASSMINKRLKLPFFVKVHGTDVNENTQYSARKELMGKWLSKADTVFCASKALASRLKDAGVPESKLAVNYNGVNAQLFYPTESHSDEKSIIFVGSLIPTKGVNELVEAFIDLQKEIPDVKLDIIGEGPLKKLLHEKAQQYQLNICIHGSIPLEQVAEKVRMSSLLVLPSYREGVPNVLLEAFASGIPVVATNVGGIPEVVNESVGILVEPQNVKQLKSAMIDAVNKTWIKEDILLHASQFNWDKNVHYVLDKMEK